jgi:hypothetical protein
MRQNQLANQVGLQMSERLLTLRLALFAAIVAISAEPLFGQAFYGFLVGTITNQSSAGVVGATIALTNVGEGERHQSKSGAGGDYRFLNLVPGTARVNVNLKVGTERATVEVAVQAAQIQTDSSAVSNPTHPQVINEVPM